VEQQRPTTATDREAHRGRLRRRNPPLRRDDITVTDEVSVRRAVKAAALGNAMEWFDFGIWGYLAITLGHVFFPPGNDTAQLLSSFATFAVAFFIRPVGGAVFGPLGDRIGRKHVLALTMILMAISTFAIGLIPSFASIGWWATGLLVLFRLVQGFSTGGEYGGAATFITEYAPDKKRGFYASFLESGTLIGYIGAAGLVTLLTTWIGDDAMREWGWRVPFLIALPLGGIGVYLRLRLEETPAFKRLEANESPQHVQGEFKDIFGAYLPRLVLCIALVAGYNVNDYLVLTYLPTYLTDQLHYKDTHGLIILLATMVFLLLIINQVGRLNDRFGRKPVLMTGMLGFLIFSVPAFLLVKQGSVIAVAAGLLILALSLVCFLATMSAALPALFPTQVRYGALAIGYNVSTSLFGGTAPFVVIWLISVTDNDLMPAYYSSAAALVGMIAVLFMRETAQQPLEGSPPAVSTEKEAAELASEATRPAEPKS
jgi:MFS transporter, MHS family, proline/betaine transporter